MSVATRTAGAGIAALIASGAAITYVDWDGGGSVYGYVAKYDDLQKRGVPVVIRGNCYSSCTMALGYSNVCLMPGAVMGFHPAYVAYGFGLFSYSLHPAATDEMRRHYPPDALAVIDAHKGLSDKGGWWRPAITLIDADEFPQKYICKGKAA